MSRSLANEGCGCGPCGCGSDSKDSKITREQLIIGQFSLASLLTSYPSGPSSERASQLLNALENPDVPHVESWRLLPPLVGSWLSPARLEDWKASYVDLFMRGQAAISLYEGDYGPSANVTKQNTLADLGGFYCAFGLDMTPAEGEREMGDHLAVELEFYSILLSKEEWFRLEGNDDANHVIRETQKPSSMIRPSWKLIARSLTWLERLGKSHQLLQRSSAISWPKRA